MSAQPTLFDGATLDPALDNDRLSKLLGRVYQVLSDGGWYTLAELQRRAGGSEASVSARIRDLRKYRYGAHVIERRRRGAPKSGLHEYRLVR